MVSYCLTDREAAKEGKIGSYCLMGIECQLYKMKKVMKMDGSDCCTTL